MIAKLDRIADNWFGFVGVITLVALLLTVFTGHQDDAWVWPVFGIIGGAAVLYMVASTVWAERSKRAYQRSLPDLTDWDMARQDPASGIWRISPPCGYEWWHLHAPGTGLPDADGFITGEPTAKFSAIDGPGDDTIRTDAPIDLAELRAWAVPWIEAESGGRVAELVEGWGAPYGPHRNLREWSAFARVVPAGDTEAGAA